MELEQEIKTTGDILRLQTTRLALLFCLPHNQYGPRKKGLKPTLRHDKSRLEDTNGAIVSVPEFAEYAPYKGFKASDRSDIYSALYMDVCQEALQKVRMLCRVFDYDIVYRNEVVRHLIDDLFVGVKDEFPCMEIDGDLFFECLVNDLTCDLLVAVDMETPGMTLSEAYQRQAQQVSE